MKLVFFLKIEFKSESFKEIINMIQIRATEYKHYIHNKTKVMGNSIRLAT